MVIILFHFVEEKQCSTASFPGCIPGTKLALVLIFNLENSLTIAFVWTLSVLHQLRAQNHIPSDVHYHRTLGTDNPTDSATLANYVHHKTLLIIAYLHD